MLNKNLLYSTLLVTSYLALPELSAYTTVNTNLETVKETFVSSENAKLFCRVIGKGKPLIIIHGGPGLTQDYLLPQMYRLAENNMVIFYDQRGCGKSTGDITQETITIDKFINDVEAIRQAFNFDKISIFGHSWGGFLAMNYAINHPEYVEKLILSNSIPASSEEYALFDQEKKKRISRYEEELAKIHNTQGYRDGDPDAIECFYRLIFKTYFYIPDKADLLNLGMPATAAVNGEKVYEIFRESIFDKPFNLHSGLKTLNVPTLIVHGDADPIPPSTAKAIHENISHSIYYLMKDCGHFPYIEDPNRYFKNISEFLNKSSSE